METTETTNEPTRRGCLGNSLLIRSSFSPLGGKPRRRNTMRSSSRRAASISLRLVEHSDSLAMTFSLKSPHISGDPGHSRVVVSRHHPTTNQGCDHRPPRTPSHPELRQQLLNPSCRPMLRHHVRHVLICANRLQQELHLLQPFLCSHVPDLQVSEPPCALPADDSAVGTAVAPHVESPGNPLRSGSGKFAVHCVANAASSG